MKRKLLLANTVLLGIVALALGLHLVMHARESSQEDQLQRQAEQTAIKVDRKAQRLRSQSNLRGLAIVLTMYHSSHGVFPGHDWKTQLIESNGVPREMFHAPGDHQGVETAYHYLGPLDTNAAGEFDEAMPLLCEDPALWDDGGWVAYADTITHWITHEELKELIANARENG